ncbi:hypothetical protein AQZ52_10840 [Novosphingobium fuchskuhlense]|uniref:Uncharacterized protein n=1 Tax=Novosphingobium fuchskuhlense TaxID=1117702 RepID=A0A117UUM0_9SPHN|nr:hypothetical protein [Novosphingobium fuchskuhlense]KUR71160.1 hypothetical protein AQZ52_10840 [Novosphingobium fuchskuhlense]
MTDEIESVKAAILSAPTRNGIVGDFLHDDEALSIALSAITALDKHRAERAGEVEKRLRSIWPTGSPNEAAGAAIMDQAAATIAALRAELAKAEERGVRMGIEAALDRLSSDDVEAALRNLNTPTGRSVLIRARALSELAAADAVLLDLPDTLADSDGDDGA